MVFSRKDGMRSNRHTTLHAARATFARMDPDLIERVKQERKRLFDNEELPEHLRYTAEEYDSIC